MPEDIRKILPQISPNFLLPFRRERIDPFTDKFEVTLRGEGMVRGTGGLRVVDDDCQTHRVGTCSPRAMPPRASWSHRPAGAVARRSRATRAAACFSARMRRRKMRASMRLRVGGLDQVWSRLEQSPAIAELAS